MACSKAQPSAASQSQKLCIITRTQNAEAARLWQQALSLTMAWFFSLLNIATLGQNHQPWLIANLTSWTYDGSEALVNCCPCNQAPTDFHDRYPLAILYSKVDSVPGFSDNDDLYRSCTNMWHWAYILGRCHARSRTNTPLLVSRVFGAHLGLPRIIYNGYSSVHCGWSLQIFYEWCLLGVMLFQEWWIIMWNWNVGEITNSKCAITYLLCVMYTQIMM